MKIILFLISSLLLLSRNIHAQVIDNGDFQAYIQTKIDAFPGKDGGDFSEPTSQQLDDWADGIADLMASEYSDAHNHFVGLGYQLVEYTDDASSEIYYIVENTGSNHWGITVYNPNPIRQHLIIQAPHPKFDTNTGDQATHVFEDIGAAWLQMAGTHRCNSSDFTSCGEGTTKSCSTSSQNYRISDLPHNVNNVFHRQTEELFNDDDDNIFIQLHGFGKGGSDPYAILSNSTNVPPTSYDYLSALADALYEEDNVLTFKIPHIDDWTKLTGTGNTQGRLINGALSELVCATKSPANSGRFLHIEQAKERLREDINGWIKMANALAKVFPQDRPGNLGIIINEIHADPAPGLDGDANGDGFRDGPGSQDEFIEIVNTSSSPVDIEFWTIHEDNSVNDRTRHVFAQYTELPAKGVIVVFGGGTPAAAPENSQFVTASTDALGFTNTVDTVRLKDDSGNIIAEHIYGNEANNNESLTRDPDFGYAGFVQHTGATGSGGTAYSPGTRIDGSNFPADEPATTVSFASYSSTVDESTAGTINIAVSITNPSSTEDTYATVALVSDGLQDFQSYEVQKLIFPAGSSANQTAQFTVFDDLIGMEFSEDHTFRLLNVHGGSAATISGSDLYTLTIIDDDRSQIIITEIYSDPHPDDPPSIPNGDANNDGTRDATDDEFVEFVNTSDVVLNINGWEIHDEDNKKYEFSGFPNVDPWQAVIIFGGGNPVGPFGNNSQFDKASSGLSLTNTGDVVEIQNASGHVVAYYEYTHTGKFDQSITLADVTSTGFALHGDLVADVASPGTNPDGSNFSTPPATEVTFGNDVVVDEDAGTVDITLNIANESAFESTIIEVPLSVGVAADIDGYTTQTVTFPPSSSSSQSITITITDDLIFEGDEVLTFGLSNIDGGNSATIGSSNTLDLTIHDNDVPLPLDFLSFEGTHLREEVILQWVTTNEINVSHFSIEFSIDERTFSEIGTHKAINQKEKINKYSFIHDHPSDAIGYYRIKEVDFDGQYLYSEIILIKSPYHQFELKFFPNPVANTLTIKTNETLKDPNFKIISMVGQMVLETQPFETAPHQYEVKLSNLQKGVYQIIFSTSTRRQQFKIYKH